MHELILLAVAISFFAVYLGGMHLFSTCQEVDHEYHSTR